MYYGSSETSSWHSSLPVASRERLRSDCRVCFCRWSYEAETVKNLQARRKETAWRSRVIGCSDVTSRATASKWPAELLLRCSSTNKLGIGQETGQVARYKKLLERGGSWKLAYLFPRKLKLRPKSRKLKAISAKGCGARESWSMASEKSRQGLG